MNIIQINTTQNVPIEFKQAGIGVRLLASMLDMIILFAYIYIVGNLMDLLRVSRLDDNWSKAAVYGMLFLPVMLYTLVTEYYLNGQTLGKKVMKIKVVKLDGYSPGFSDYFIRWIFRIIDIWVLTPIIGIISMTIAENGQRFGGMASGTAVISIKRRHHIDASILEDIKEDYKVIFPSVLMLSDRDIQIIKDNYRRALKSRDYKLLKALRTKVVSIIREEGKGMTDNEYLDTVLKDYTQMTKDA